MKVDGLLQKAERDDRIVRTRDDRAARVRHRNAFADGRRSQRFAGKQNLQQQIPIQPTRNRNEINHCRQHRLHVGALDEDNSPNVDSLVFFVQEVAPRLDALIGATWTLTVAGTEKPDHGLTIVSMLHLAEGTEYRLVGESAAGLDGELSDALSAIPYAAIAVVALGFNQATLENPLDGFGFLTTKKDRRKVLGVLWGFRPVGLALLLAAMVRISRAALKGPLGNLPAFRKKIQALLGDEAARKQLMKELGLGE